MLRNISKDSAFDASWNQLIVFGLQLVVKMFTKDEKNDNFKKYLIDRE